MQIIPIKNNSQNFKATITTYKLDLPNKKGKCKYRPKTQKTEDVIDNIHMQEAYDRWIRKAILGFSNKEGYMSEGEYTDFVQLLRNCKLQAPSLNELPFNVRISGLVKYIINYNIKDNKRIGLNLNIPNGLNVYVKL